MDHTGRRHERVGILGVDPALDGMARERDVTLLVGEALAGRDPNLFLDDVNAGDHFGDRMFDLQTRVGFHEVEAAVGIHQELERPRVGVLHGLRRVDDDRAHPFVHLVAQRHGG